MAPVAPLIEAARSARPPLPAQDAAPLAVGADVARVERMLPNLAKDYPRIFPWLINLEYAVADEARDASLYLAGRRTGAWVYKRDFALGAKLGMTDALRRIAVPALRGLVTVEQHDHQLHLRGCPLCHADSAGRCNTLKTARAAGVLQDVTTTCDSLHRHPDWPDVGSLATR